MSFDDPHASSQRSLGQLLADFASPAPVPGGGSAAALAGALAAALVAMVAGLGAKHKSADKAEGELLQEMLSRVQPLQERLAALIDEDAEAYAHVRAAYRLARNTEGERAIRAKRIEAALRLAVAPPLATAAACAELLPLAALAAERGPHSASSDAYVAALLAQACLLASEQNVLADLKGVHDEALRARLERQLAAMRATAAEALARARAASRPEG